MKRTQLLTELIRTRAEVQALLNDLGENHMLVPGADGTWSVRDVLAHLTACEVDMLTNLGRVKRGAKPGTVQLSKAAIQKQNETWHSEMKDRPLHRVMLDFDGARKQTLRVLEGLSDQEAAQPVDWLQGRSLVDYAIEMTLSHEREHLEQLRRWRGEASGDLKGGTAPNGSGPREV